MNKYNKNKIVQIKENKSTILYSDEGMQKASEKIELMESYVLSVTIYQRK